MHSSFPVIHKVDNVGIFVLLKFENKLNVVIVHTNFISKHHDKYKFALKFIQFVTISTLFPLEVVQKCQLCQTLCITRKFERIALSSLM